MNRIMFRTIFKILLPILLIFTIKSLKSQSFIEITNGLPQLKSSNAVCTDFNNDGITDILLSGRNAFQNVHMDLFLGDGKGEFVKANSNLPNLYNVDFCIYDFNADGYSDVLLNGKTAIGNAMCGLYLNNGNNTFVLEKHFGKLNHATVDIGDFNQDGLMDVAYTGQNSDSQRKFFIYIRSNENFLKIEKSDIPGMTHGTLKSVDMNNDALPDLIYSGITDYGKSFSVFLNVGDLVFIGKPVSIPAVSDGDIQLFDANADGNIDIAITGSKSDGSLLNAVFFQDGNLNFSKSENNFPGLHYSSLSIGDLNNDGFSDLIMNGQRASGLAYSAIYLNTQNGIFFFHSDGFADTKNGAIKLMDFDNDHDLDVLFTGLGNTDPRTILLNNTDLPDVNTKPSVPENLISYTQDNQIYFEWDNSVDIQTTSNTLLKYHVAIGRKSGNYNIIPGILENSGCTETRWANRSLFSDNNATFKLSEGDYYWKVQAMDNGFLTSGYSFEKHMQFCIDFSLGKDTSICLNDTLILTSPKEGISYVWLFNGLLISDSSSLALKANVSGELLLTVESETGCIVSDTIQIDVLVPPMVNLGCDTIRCPNDTIPIFNNLDPSLKLDWYDLKGDPLYGGLKSFQFCDDQLDGLIAIATGKSGCISKDSIMISTIEPTYPQLINDTAICEGDSLHFSVEKDLSLPKWNYYENALIENHFFDYHAMSHDTIHFKALSKEKCSVSKNIVIYVHPLPDTSIPEDTSLCHGDVLHITKFNTNQHTFSWISKKGAPFDISGDTLSYTVLQNDTLVLHITNEFNCTAADSISIAHDPLPFFSLPNTISYCSGDSVNVNIEETSSSDIIHWVNMQGYVFSNDTSFCHNPYDKEKILVKVYTEKGCSLTDTLTFIEEKYVHLFPVTDTMVCPDTDVLITLSDKESFQNLSLSMLHTEVFLDSSKAIRFYTSTADTILASYTAHVHCSFHDTLAVSLLKRPQINLPNHVNLCLGDTIWYSPVMKSEAYTLKWYNRHGSLLSGSDSLKLTSTIDTTLIAIATDIHGCWSADSMKIHSLSIPRINLPQTFAYCIGDSIKFEVPYDSANWTFMDHGITGSEFHSIFKDPAFLVVSVTDSMECTNIAAISLTAHPTPKIYLPDDTTICAGQPFAMHYQVKPGESATWRSNNGSAIPNPLQLSTDTSKTMFLEVKNKQGCSAIDTMQISLFEVPKLWLADTIHVCQGKWAQTSDYLMSGANTQKWFYQWHPKERFHDATSVYTRFSSNRDFHISLVIHDGHCQGDTLKSNVLHHENPHLITSNDTSVGNGSQAALFAISTSSCKFTWYPDDYMFSSATAAPVVFPPITTTYYVQATDAFGCFSKDSVTVHIQNNIFIPNLFSPNDDGHNDTFKVYGSGIQDLEIKIFALSGELVWETRNLREICANGWNGFVSGKPAPTATYIWQISGRYANGEEILYNRSNTGMIQLIR